MANSKNVYIGAYLEVKETEKFWRMFEDTEFEDNLAEITPQYWEEIPKDTIYLIGNLSDRKNGCINTDCEGLVKELHPFWSRASEVEFAFSYRKEIEHLKGIVGDSNVKLKFGVIIYYS